MKAYVIILQDHELGEEVGAQAIEAAQQFDIDAIRYNAVDGYYSKAKFDRYGIDKFLNYTIIDKPGHQGCFLSHYELWIKCVELNEPIIIMEHDGIFIRPLPEDILDHFDEVMRLDCFQWFMDGYNESVEESISQPIDYFHRTFDYEYYCTGGYYIGAYGYIIKPAGAKKLIEFAKNRGVVCTEVMLGEKIVNVVSTTATVIRMHPHYIGQDVKFSTTYNLGLAKPGNNSLVNPTYISPSRYRKLYLN